jgi:serine/threonine protein kinase
MLTYCFNPHCSNPENINTDKFCINCGANLLLHKRYRAVKRMGKSARGQTFLAVDEIKPSQPLCIKQFFPSIPSNTNFQDIGELFCKKALQFKKLNHPQIPQILDYFIQDDLYYLLQEFIDGQNLTEQLLDDGTFSEHQIRQLLKDVLPILKNLHNQKVIHGDIKPENIIHRGEDRRIFLVDLGADWLMNENFLANKTRVSGNPQYAAPEQVMGKTVFASDLYSLGVTCIHLLTLVDPFDLFYSRENTWVWRDFLVNNPVSHELGNILDKLMATSINQRYHSADAVMADLEPQPIRWLEYDASSQIQWQEKKPKMILWRDIKNHS